MPKYFLSGTPQSSATSRASNIPNILSKKHLPASFIHRIASRTAFIPGTGPHAPVITARIPVSLWVFGVQVEGIIDTGSERSYINSRIYEKVYELSSGG